MFKKICSCFIAATIFAIMTSGIVFAEESAVGINWEKGVIRASGLAAGKASTKNKGLRRAQAKQAAKMVAQRNLAESVEGVQVTSDASARDLELEYDIIKTSVNATIKGMTEISTQYFNDETCEVVLEMPLFGSSRSLAKSVFLPFREEQKEDFPKPSVTVNIMNEPTASRQKYTGLIIDCRGMNLNPVMSPVIKNADGQAIYGHKNLDYDKIIERGMVSYVNSDNSEAKSRAGNNPLLIKAVALEGNNANPVVSVSDADNILQANQYGKFLDNCAVVFIR